MTNTDRVLVPARRRRRFWWSVLGAGLVLAAGVSLLASYAAYREWPWSDYPSRLYACGRDFTASPRTETRAQIEARGEHITTVGSVPGWLNHGELWAAQGNPLTPGSTCHVVMWIRSGNRFKTYSLSGGP